MSCQNTEDVRIIVKYSSFPGDTPTIPNSANHEDGTWLPTDLYVGEMFVNAYDNKAWVRGIDGIFPLGATGGTVSFIGDFVHASTGGTFSGPVTTTTLTTGTVSAVSITASNIFGDIITANYFIGDGSGLTNIQAVWNGGTVSNPVLFLGDTTHNGFTNIEGTLRGDAFDNIKADGNIVVSAGYGVSASYFVGDGSQLTNLPVGTYSNYYTTQAALSGNTIVFDRTDLAGAYSVDLTPILATDSIASINWDSTFGQLEVTYFSGYQVSAVIDAFPNLTTNILNANYIYGGEFWGSFNGTFSGTIDGDIYTTAATLNGTVVDFSRTDGNTYSVDLSSLSGAGGTQSLEQTLKQGNTMGTYSIVGGTAASVAKFRVYDEFINLRNESPVDIVDISMSPSEILVYNSTGKGITYDSPDPNLFMTNTLVHKQYVDDATGLENTLAKSNVTGDNDIVITNNGMGATAFGIKTLSNTLADARFTFVDYDNAGKWAPSMRADTADRENYITVGENETYIKNTYTDISTNVYGQVYVDPLFVQMKAEDILFGMSATKAVYSYQAVTDVTNGVENTNTTQNIQSISMIVDSGSAATGSTTFDMGQTDIQARVDVVNDGGTTVLTTGLHSFQSSGVATTEITTANTSQSLAASIYNTYDPGYSRVENILQVNASNPYGSPYVTTITQRGDEILVAGNAGSFRGIEYAADYSAEFTANSLVTKDWVLANQTTSLTDTVCNRTDEIFVDASGGEYQCNPYIFPTPSYTTIRSAMTGATAAIYVDPDTIRLNVVEIPGSYESDVTITDETITMFGGRSDANNQTTWGMELGTEVRRYRYEHPSTPWGDIDKFEEKRYVLHKQFSNSSGTPGQEDLYYENFVQDAINDFEIDFYIMNNESYVLQKKYMTKSYKRRVYYDNYNQATILIPDETKQGDTLDPAYNSWSITTQTGIYGTKYVLDHTLDGSYDYSVTIVVRQTAKKY